MTPDETQETRVPPTGQEPAAHPTGSPNRKHPPKRKPGYTGKPSWPSAR